MSFSVRSDVCNCFAEDGLDEFEKDDFVGDDFEEEEQERADNDEERHKKKKKRKKRFSF